MSFNIYDMMKLPSFREAKVVAGHEGMNKSITSISVLEMDDPDILGFDAYGHTRYFGNEIIITAFISSRDDVERQCQTVRRLKNEGEMGIIIFYVGCILPKIDDKLIILANELGMPLIVMPEGRIELRYSDVICDVMEAVIKDREENIYFAAELIERISHIDKSKQSITGVLSLIRERIHCSIYILDEADEILNFSEWPNERNLPIKDIIKMMNVNLKRNEIKTIIIGDFSFYVQWSLIECESSSLNLLIIKEKADLTLDSCNQINYIVKTYVNLWTNNYGQLNTKQLVNAIINDEAEKMHLVAEKLNINISKFAYTYFFYNVNYNIHDYNSLKKIKNEIKEYVGMYKGSFLVDIFDETIVVCADQNKDKLDRDLEKHINEIERHGDNFCVAIIDTISTIKEVKETYWLLQRYN